MVEGGAVARAEGAADHRALERELAADEGLGDAGEGEAGGAEAPAVGGVDVREPGGLGEPVALEHHHPAGVEPLRHPDRERRADGDGEAEPVAEHVGEGVEGGAAVLSAM